MPPSTSLLLYAALGRGGRASKTSACPTYPWWPKTRTPSGSPSRSPIGTAAKSAWSSSLPRRPCGIPRPCSSYPSAGPGARPARRVQAAGHPVYRSWRRSAEDLLLVRDAMAVGGDLPGGEETPWLRDAGTAVWVSDATHHTGTIGIVLAGRPVSETPNEAGRGRFAASGGLVPQSSSYLRRCARLVRKPGRAERADKQRRRSSVPTSFTNVREN